MTVTSSWIKKFKQWLLWLLCCAQQCSTLCNPLNCSLPSPLSRDSQAGILEWVAVSQPRGRTHHWWVPYHWCHLGTPSSHMKWTESCSVVSDSLQPHGLYSPWNSPEYWTGYPIPSPEDLPGIELGPPALQAGSLPSELWGKPNWAMREAVK